MDVHVTGGSGFLGSHVVPRLVARGHRVSCLCRSQRAQARVEAMGAEALSGDLDNPVSIDAALSASRAEGLVNLASLAFGHAAAIVAGAEEAGIKRAVFVSTTAIFTTLNAPTRALRLAAEESIRRSALDWTIIRPTMIYGSPGDRNMERLVRMLRRSPVMVLPGDGERLQQPVHVDDLADAVVAAIEAPVAVGQAYDVAGPEPLTFRQVIDQAAHAVGRHPRLVSVPLGPAIRVLQLYERAARQPRIRAEQLARLDEDKAFDIGLARRDLGFDPRSFMEGIRHEAELAR